MIMDSGSEQGKEQTSDDMKQMKNTAIQNLVIWK